MAHVITVFSKGFIPYFSNDIKMYITEIHTKTGEEYSKSSKLKDAKIWSKTDAEKFNKENLNNKGTIQLYESYRVKVVQNNGKIKYLTFEQSEDPSNFFI